jgi:hypothetical protein
VRLGRTPRRLGRALAAIWLLDKVSTGLQQKLKQDIDKSLMADGVNAG